MVSQLEVSAKRTSMEIYTKALTWTVHQLGKGHEFEEFVAGIPDLYESKDFVTTADIRRVERDFPPRYAEREIQVHFAAHHNIRRILAVLPGPTSFDAPLSWSILRLAHGAMLSKLPKQIQQKKIQTCLKALHHIPGAIRDVLTPYAVLEDHSIFTQGLLNIQESLDIIVEFWDAPNADVALSVRCAAAAVAAFMINPPRAALDLFAALHLCFIGNDNTGKKFLAERLHVSPTADGRVAPEFEPNSDTARLQNIVRFLADISDLLRYMNNEEWSSHNPNSILRERHTISESRYTESYDSYRDGFGLFDQKGNRVSPGFIPAAQQDLIILTLEILARHSVADAATP
ncbi:hypothetical protein V8E53_009853 [Lactarius tabidus]